MQQIDQAKILFTNYQGFIILILATAVISFILTPLTGVLAQKIGAIDAPARMRDRSDNTRERRIHANAMPRLGGLAIAIAFFVGVIVAAATGYVNFNTQQLMHILIGGAILVFLGFIDSVSDVSSKTQFLIQIFVALLITTSGIRIDFIEILNTTIVFNIAEFNLNLGPLALSVSPLADLITIFWIVGVINAINWVSGIDGLAAGMSFFAALTMVFLGVKFDTALTVSAAVIAASLAGSILGFLPFNFPPAKTFNGSIGDFLQGYLLAVLAIISVTKLSSSIILLALPLIDATWVLIGRYRKHRKELRSPLDILKVSDKTHLHHRLMDLGLSIRQTLSVEVIIFLLFAVTAYYFAGFSEETILMLVALLVCLALFTLLAISRNRNYHFGKKSKVQTETEDVDPVKVVNETPEEKYAY